LYTCLSDAFDFLPLCHFSAASGGLPNLSMVEQSLKLRLFYQLCIHHFNKSNGLYRKPLTSLRDDLESDPAAGSDIDQDNIERTALIFDDLQKLL